MKLAVFGATGGTGRHVIRQALCAGHEIRALVRSPGKISSCSDLTVIKGDVLDPQSIATAVDGTDAVLCLLGKTPNNPEDIVSRGTEHIITAMEARDINPSGLSNVLLTEYTDSQTLRSRNSCTQYFAVAT